MLDLENKKLSWILVPNKLGVDSFLYSRNYNIFYLKKYISGNFEDWIICFTNTLSENDIRKDIIHIMKHFYVDSLWVKYYGIDIRLMLDNGFEKLQEFNNEHSDYKFIFQTQTFSFNDVKRRIKPSGKSDFKVGTLVECLNLNNWVQMEVKDPEKEWNNIYKLMMKYDKVRIIQNN